MPQYSELSERYERGKFLITFLVSAFTLTGVVIEGFNMYYEYSTTGFWAQIFLFIVSLYAIITILIDSKTKERAFLILSYSMFLNITFTWLLGENFSGETDDFKSQLIQRDVFFLFMFCFLSSIFLSLKHFIAQAILLISFISSQVILSTSEFFQKSGLLIIVVLLGALIMMYYFSNIISELLEGFRNSVRMSSEVMQMEQKKKSVLIRYNQSVLQLSREDVLYQRGIDYVFQTVSEQAQKEMGLSLVSIWLINEDRSGMNRHFVLDEGKAARDLLNLSKSGHEAYFDALESESVIVASDARKHPYTSVFTEDYFKAFDIYSLLDSPIMIDGQLIGVICCEQKYQVREWTEEDILYVRILSEFCAIGFKNEQIKSLLEALGQKRKELEEKNMEILAINEDLQSLNDHLSANNGSLEAMVKIRTKVLEQQNEQLMEYAFINSHLLRAPLARIMGLSNLIIRDVVYTEQDKQLIMALQQSSNELDAIIKRISEVLYDGHSFSREDIQEIIDRNLNKQKV
jgi:DNA-binding transcriptional MerR regulator